jgi:DNA gyrase subunit A
LYLHHDGTADKTRCVTPNRGKVGVPGRLLFDSVVIELKQDAVAAVVLNNLHKKTPLQTSSFSGNFLALMGSGTKP